MQAIHDLVRVAGTVALAAFCTAAPAQSGLEFKYLCYSVGFNPPQPIGDRDGHSISSGQFTCRVEGGPLDGAILTSSGSIYEWDGNNATLLSTSGVIRKPGAMAVAQGIEGKLTNTITDGKVTGFSGAGRSAFKLSTGAAAALSGKTYSWKVSSTAPGQFVVEAKMDGPQ